MLSPIGRADPSAPSSLSQFLAPPNAVSKHHTDPVEDKVEVEREEARPPCRALSAKKRTAGSLGRLDMIYMLSSSPALKCDAHGCLELKIPTLISEIAL